MALTTAQYRELDSAHFLHPFTDHRRMHKTGARIIERAEGIYLWDSDGNKLLDGMAGLWCVNVGYGRKELAEVARQQMETLPYYNTFFQTTHPPVIDLSQLLSEITPPHLNHVFLTNSGSESNDTVVRMARYFWSCMGHPEKQVIISRRNAYHGSTIAGASLSGMAAMHAQGGLPIPDIVHIGQPYWYREGGDLSPDDFGKQVAGELEKKIEELGEHRVAAFIAEPIQGAGGVIVPPDSYWPEISAICKRHQILLVADEVICGFGRTGEWFGSDYYNIDPDLMPIAKGLSSGYLPIGGVMVADHVVRVLIDEGGEFAHGMTYAGHPAPTRGWSPRPISASCGTKASSIPYARIPARTCSNAGANSATIPSWERCGAWAFWAPWNWWQIKLPTPRLSRLAKQVHCAGISLLIWAW
jgi:putrescine aminotransferase